MGSLILYISTKLQGLLVDSILKIIYNYGKDFVSLGFHLLLTSQSNDKL